jgi:Holliday junction resolvase
VTNKSKARGTAWETRLVNYLKEHGFPLAERRALSGSNDRGDVSGIVGVVIEAKNQQTLGLAEWIDETVVEKQNAGASIGVCVFPRRNKTTGRAYVLMELDQFIEMIL